MKSMITTALHRLANGLRRRGFGEQPAPDLLDAYGREAPSAQQAVNIFQGAWSSSFPPEVEVQAGTSALFHDPRLLRLIEMTGGVQDLRVLELGPLEGAHSYLLEKAGARHVLAIEACVISYLKCLMVKEITKLQRVAFEFGNFVPYLDQTTERFDLIVASGVLYHQKDPVRVLRAIAQRTDRLFLWTHYHQDGLDTENIRARDFQRVRGSGVDGFECDLFRLEYDTYLKAVKYRGGVDAFSHWMGRDDLLACLRHFGLTRVEIAFEQTDHPFGPNLTLLAERPRSS